MAKEIKFPITSFRNFHQVVNTPIRTKSDLIKVLLLSMKFILLKEEFKDEDKGMVSVVIDKISRIYFICKEPNHLPDKYYSFAFPFFLESINNNEWIIKCKTTQEPIDSELIDSLLSLLDNGWFSDCNDNLSTLDSFACDYLDAIEDYYIIRDPISYDQGFHEQVNWSVIKTLLTFEPSYVRYDYDEKHENPNHPLNHLDIHYTPSGTFKLGFDSSLNIKDRLDFKKFQDILENGKYYQDRCYNLK